MAGLADVPYNGNGPKGKIVVVCGPTATGKSALALALARRFGGEVVGADSMQVYRGLTVGTAAITPQQAGGIPQHLVGFLPPQRRFSVAEWLTLARQAIDDILSRKALPVVCGGTGLYIKSLVEGLTYPEAAPDEALREALEAQWQAFGPEGMLQKLAEVDPAHAEKLSPADKKRILRALEQCMQTGQNAAERQALSRAVPPAYTALCLGLDYPDRADLYAAVNARVDGMMTEGLLDEARVVYDNRKQYLTAAQAIGYKEFFPYYDEEAPLEGCVDALKQATRRYAKRQLTWFRRMEGVRWLDAADPRRFERAEDEVETFLRA